MALDKVKDVDVEADGVFKYILIELSEKPNKKGERGGGGGGGEARGGAGDECRKKTVVRGYEWAEFHGEWRGCASFLIARSWYLLHKMAKTATSYSWQ